MQAEIPDPGPGPASSRDPLKGRANRLTAVRWGIAGRIVWAWVLTMPMSAFMAAIAYVILQ